jgi:regulatory protein
MVSIRNRALGFLARREHSRAELKRKLSKNLADSDSLDSNQLEAVLLTLTEQGLQSDARFTESYVNSRLRSGYGPIRITRELEHKGVSNDLVVQYLPKCPEIWHQGLLSVWEKKYHGQRPVDAKTYAKQCRFLLQRGFSMEMIHQLDLYRG